MKTTILCSQQNVESYVYILTYSTGFKDRTIDSSWYRGVGTCLSFCIRGATLLGGGGLAGAGGGA